MCSQLRILKGRGVQIKIGASKVLEVTDDILVKNEWNNTYSVYTHNHFSSIVNMAKNIHLTSTLWQAKRFSKKTHFY